MAETREHVPSKVFLQTPYPNDLPTVPSCEECNNGFSSDELYTAVLLELLKNYRQNYYILNKKTHKRLERKEGKQAQNAFESYLLHPSSLFDDFKIKRVLQKLAICHAVYEVSEGYHGDAWESNVQGIEFKLLPYMTQDEYEDMDSFEVMTLLPEVGSLGHERIAVFEITSLTQESDLPQKTILPFATWYEVQDGYYRYLTVVDNTSILVKIIIGEFLFTEVWFKDQK